MPTHHEIDPVAGEIFLAGERVPPGIYRQVGSQREICLDCEDTLPASLDGRVACYERVHFTWALIQDRQQIEVEEKIEAEQSECKEPEGEARGGRTICRIRANGYEREERARLLPWIEERF